MLNYIVISHHIRCLASWSFQPQQLAEVLIAAHTGKVEFFHMKANTFHKLCVLVTAHLVPKLSKWPGIQWPVFQRNGMHV